MSKAKALKYTILWAVLAAILLIAHITLFGTFFALLAVISLITWLMKAMRDEATIQEAGARQKHEATRLPELPAMTSKGSDRLFVPPPLDRRS